MGCAYILAAVTLTTYIVMGVLEGQPKCSPKSFFHQASAWCALVGGGAYGLGLYDAGLIPGFNWWIMGAVIFGSLGAVVIAKIMRRK